MVILPVDGLLSCLYRQSLLCAQQTLSKDNWPSLFTLKNYTVQGELQSAWQQQVQQQLQQLERQLDQDHVPGRLAGMEQALRQLQAQADAAPTHSSLGSLRTHGECLHDS